MRSKREGRGGKGRKRGNQEESEKGGRREAEEGGQEERERGRQREEEGYDPNLGLVAEHVRSSTAAAAEGEHVRSSNRWGHALHVKQPCTAERGPL